MFTNLKRGWAINLTLYVNFYIKTYNPESFVRNPECEDAVMTVFVCIMFSLSE